MTQSKPAAFWFVIGSQHLYGEETLQQVHEHAQTMATHLQCVSPFPVLCKPVVTTADAILALCLAANGDDDCAGVITWMHTFSPAKMWIAGLSQLRKPLLHLHTQYNREIPWGQIDMDFMNLNQSAHGDREYGFIGTRMGVVRKVIAGHWQDLEVQRRVADWMRTAVAFVAGRRLRVARFGDNMRDVAVTEGDKVEAQIQLGWTIHGFGTGDLVQRVNQVSDADVDALMAAYEASYDVPATGVTDQFWQSVREQARMELGLQAFLTEGRFDAFTTTFEDLHGLPQLPGLAVQRLMATGYGFGGEGDWKTAALVRTMKTMAGGQGTSFMEDYTYHLQPGNELVLGAHMLEVCPTIAATRPRLEVHPLSIGGKADPARLVFDGSAGSAVCASLIDLGHRFRLVVNAVDAVPIEEEMPNLPVARVLWKPQPSLSTAAEAWILAGGAHHTAFSYQVSVEQLMDWADMAGIECVVIDKQTTPSALQKELRWNEAAWRLR